MNTLSFKDTLIISLGCITLYLISPDFKEFLASFKRDVKDFDNGIPEIEMEKVYDEIHEEKPLIYGPFPESYYSKDKEESDFSDISVTHVEDFDKFRKLFRSI